MYEDQTYEVILQRLLDRVDNGVDKRPGSIIYDALAPAAAEFAQMYIDLNADLNLRFAPTATDEYLDRAIAWSGIKRKAATKAHLRGVFYDSAGGLFDIPIGSRFSLDDLNYTAINKLSAGNFTLECETAGAVGNRYFGDLLPIDYIDGLARGEITEVLIPGEDKESDTTLYERYQEKVSRPVTSGNRYQYEIWARELPGVGRAKAFPEWAGPGTVKVVLLDNDMRSPSVAVVQAVQDYIDPTQDGMGEGAAPVGPVVTVTAAEEVPINVSVSVTLATGATTEQVAEQIEAGLKTYLTNLAFTDPLVRYTRIQSIILDIPPVIDYADLLVNGQTSNIEMQPGQVAVPGTVTVT